MNFYKNFVPKTWFQQHFFFYYLDGIFSYSSVTIYFYIYTSVFFITIPYAYNIIYSIKHFYQ